MSTATSRSQRCCRPKRRISLWRAKDRLACRFRLDGSMEASHLHAAVKSVPVCGDHSACRTYMRAFQSQAIARNPRLVDFGALSSPPNPLQVGAGRTAQAFVSWDLPFHHPLSEAACRWRHVWVLEVKIFYFFVRVRTTRHTGVSHCTALHIKATHMHDAHTYCTYTTTRQHATTPARKGSCSGGRTRGLTNQEGTHAKRPKHRGAHT